MKTAEELKAIKAEYESLKEKLSELTEDEMNPVIGGQDEIVFDKPDLPKPKEYEIHIYTPDNDKNFK